MKTKTRTFLFVFCLAAMLLSFVAFSSNASNGDNCFGNAEAKASPTPKPKQKTNKPRKRKVKREEIESPCKYPPRVNLATSSSTLYLPCDEGISSSDCPNNNNYLLDISANATDPDGNTLYYTYTVNAGVIIGTGGNVQWDLSGVPIGKYQITVKVDDGRGLVTTLSKEIEIVKCECKPPIPTPSPTPAPSPNTNDKYGFIIGIPLRQKPTEMPPNKPPELDSKLSTSIVYLPCDDGKNCPNEEKPLIDVFAEAIDPDGDSLLYTYDVTGGKIIGSGKDVQWDLSDIQPGKYQIRIEVDDGHGAIVEETKEIEVVKCKCGQTEAVCK